MKYQLARSSMIREIYRSLINNGRTYAAFDKARTLKLITKSGSRNKILDPMAGYGSLMRFCSELNIPTVNLEYNPASYLWMVLVNPSNSAVINSTICSLAEKIPGLPTISCKAAVSEEWFPVQSLEVILNLFSYIKKIASEFTNKVNAVEISLALLLPFIGRLSSSVPGSSVTHVKPGGICVYTGWQDEFRLYLSLIQERIKFSMNKGPYAEHTIIFGDLRNIVFNDKFSRLISSPPYPNSRDYSKMFAPENYFLEYLRELNLLNGLEIKTPLISSNTISGIKKNNMVDFSNLLSSSARHFLHEIENFRGTKRAKYDNKIYYIPYFGYYFRELEKAFVNLSKYLSDDFEGFLVVVNNTARNQIIPVAQSIVEVWSNLGFNAKIEDELSRELSHFGSINPSVKGFKAKHMEYTIRIWRS